MVILKRTGGVDAWPVWRGPGIEGSQVDSFNLPLTNSKSCVIN